MVDGEIDDALADRGNSHVHDEIRGENVVERALRVDPGDEFEVIGLVHEPGNQAAQFACRADDGDRGCHPSNLPSRTRPIEPAEI
jgi:hypothetical protein